MLPSRSTRSRARSAVRTALVRRPGRLLGPGGGQLAPFPGGLEFLLAPGQLFPQLPYGVGELRGLHGGRCQLLLMLPGFRCSGTRCFFRVLEQSPGPLHCRRSGFPRVRPDGPQPGLVRVFCGRGSGAAGCSGAFRRRAKRGTPRRYHEAGQRNGTRKIHDVDAVGGQPPEQAARLYGSGGPLIRRRRAQGLLHLRRNRSADLPAQIFGDRLRGLDRTDQQLAPLLSQPSELRGVEGGLRGAHRLPQRGEFADDLRPPGREHVHCPRRHGRLGQGTHVRGEGPVFRGGCVFGGYGPLGNKFVEGEGIELRRNVRQASLFHARIIEARPRQSRATGR